MASIFNRARAVRGGLTAFVAATALASTSAAVAADGPTVTRAPNIVGKVTVGETLRAVNGTWTGTDDTATGYAWLRCPDEDYEDCTTISRATEDSYELTEADVGNTMRVTLWAVEGEESSHLTSDPTDVVAKVSTPGSTPDTPGNTPATPSFDIAGRTPIGGAPPKALNLKLIKPTPVVRITGRYTKTGAQITRFTVKSPKGATVKLACSKGTCPVRRQTLKGGHTSRLSKFERALKAGTRIELTVSRKGYVSQVTVITIRRNAKPSRSDGCLLPGKNKLSRCPA